MQEMPSSDKIIWDDKTSSNPDKGFRLNIPNNCSQIFFNDLLGLNLFERRRMRCADYTMVSDPQQENPDRVQEDMFKMKQDYANFTGRVKTGSTGNLKVSQGA